MTDTNKFSELLAVQKAEMLSAVTHILKAPCQNCGSEACPTCGSKKSGKGERPAGPNTQNGQQNNTSTSTGVSVNSESGVSDMNANPTNEPQNQIISAADMVQRMGGALKHPVQVNHDASGVGVTHAAMLVHPEWNHDHIKTKIDGHLKAKGWKAGKNKEHGGKTYESDGHKIHMAHVGQHLLVTGQNKKGHPATPMPQPQVDAKGKPIKKAFMDNNILENLQMEIDSTITSISELPVKKQQ